ncbi:unnamed protein product [Trichogramma brassicae]|uniref:Integrase catalytic domain-containing protein n=1 Tax=Trichogramma brassicae TaxID=86971 RepID=A0A6H5J6Z8_9HYME|nr:unnamed protein product [Trichogramma brassicae]
MSPPLDFAGRHALICSVTVPAVEESTVVTKRRILSEVARIYDPTGWIAPVVVRAKILLQYLWLQGHNWDQLADASTAEACLNSGASCLRCKLCKYLVGSVLSSIHLSSYMDFRMLLNEHTLLSSILSDKTVREIHSLLPNASWSHVSSEENPADVASRGCTPSQLKSDLLWWHGPPWLQSLEQSPPHQDMEPSTELEKRAERSCFTVTQGDSIETLLNRFSSLDRLIKVIAYCLRWKQFRLPHKKVLSDPTITVAEFAEARKAICLAVQALFFSEEIKSLAENKDFPRSSPLLRFRPFLDKQGLLRVGGRLNYSHLSFNEKHPVIIPHASRFSELLIYHAHQVTLHGGPQLVQSHLCRRWWIVQARNRIRQIIHSCPTCARYQGRRMEQLMAPLPAFRVTASRPFTATGLDYAGPFALRASKGRGQKSFKGYVAVFTCFATRAMHLEVVSDYTSKTFLMALRRFFARRGLSRRLVTDNGTTFQGAVSELQKMFRAASAFHNEVSAVLTRDEIQWDFIPPRAPHFGGLWEAGVKAFKFHLKRIIGETRLTFEEFSTLTAQIEACLNSRPISPLSADSQDVAALTPGHFLIGSTLLSAPEPAEEEPLEGLPRWKIAMQMRNHFWRRWYREVLHHMQVRQKWPTVQSGLKLGDLVLITEDMQPPQRWPLARVEQLHPGADGLTRVVTLRTATTRLRRPITNSPWARPVIAPYRAQVLRGPAVSVDRGLMAPDFVKDRKNVFRKIGSTVPGDKTLYEVRPSKSRAQPFKPEIPILDEENPNVLFPDEIEIDEVPQMEDPHCDDGTDTEDVVISPDENEETAETDNEGDDEGNDEGDDEGDDEGYYNNFDDNRIWIKLFFKDEYVLQSIQVIIKPKNVRQHN